MDDRGQEKLTRRQLKTIQALLTERTHQDAIKAAGIGSTTLTRWMHNSLFKAALVKAEAELMGATTRRLVGYTTAACETLYQEMINLENTPGTRIRAAGQLLEYARQYKQLENLESRMLELEGLVYGRFK